VVKGQAGVTPRYFCLAGALYIDCDPLKPPREDWLVSNLARKYTGSTIFTACIVYTAIVCWHVHT